MNALLWKDYRINRLVVIVAVVILFGPLIAASIVNGIAQMRYHAMVNWFEVVTQTACVTLAFSLVTVALAGANAFAGERADRSAEFMAYLPPTRKQKLCSKLIVASCVISLVVIVLLLMFYALAPLAGEETTQTVRLRQDFSCVMWPTVVLIFGAAWCGSSVLSSPTFAAGIGFFAPWVLFALMALVCYGFDLVNVNKQLWWIWTATPLGVLAFAVGCVWYLRRIEP